MHQQELVMSKPKILIAESSHIVIQIEQRCLQFSGVNIFTATDSEEALSIARKVRPDLIYLSFNLHGAGGIACCKALKSDPDLRETPVVMVCTASGEEPGLSLAAGCDAVVARPINRREFLETGLSLIPRTAPSGERMPCRSIVACSTGADTFYGSIEDISSSGMFVGSSREVAAGDLLTVKFVLPQSGAEPIETAAQVNWVNGSKHLRNDRLPPGFGVLFLELEADANEQIKDYMNLIRLQLDW
jgi:CheY-like chemotaxis protein